MLSIILASKSKVREKILKDNNLLYQVIPSNIDEDPVKDSLIQIGASPETVSKNLAELKANKVSQVNEGKTKEQGGSSQNTSKIKWQNSLFNKLCVYFKRWLYGLEFH